MSENTITWSEDGGIVTLCFNDPTQSVNTMSENYLASMNAVLNRLETEREQLVGVILTSAKKSFFAGGDLRELFAARIEEAEVLTDFTAHAKSQLRRLETLGIPVVAAINGSALGGGLELALAAHHRICLNDPRVRLGLPEVTLGLLPGGGGVVRSVRLLGLDTALDKLLLTGKTYTPGQAQELGLVHELVNTPEELAVHAKTWIITHPGSRQPWDDGSPIPGGTAYDPAVEATLAIRTAALRAQHKGAPMPAPAAILSAAVEGTQVDFESASAIETRYFVELATGQVSKNIIQGTYFDRRTVATGASRPAGYPTRTTSSIAVIGAGLMGAGIALSAALADIDVILKDVDLASAIRGKNYAERYLAKEVARGKRTEDQAQAVLTRIRVTEKIDDLAAVDVLIEAVFENPDLKKAVFSDVARVLTADTLVCTNTSTLPISGLAHAVDRPEDFIGLHFFSPVERMELVEIIVGEQTSEASLARAFDLVRQFGKTPIVVGDGRGFFTSRVILNRLLEAAAMVGEGISPASIEQASVQAGYPLGTLALLDELTLTLPYGIYEQFREEARSTGKGMPVHPGAAVLATMIEDKNRPSRSAGSGFYEYHDGRRHGLWAGLEDAFGPSAPPEDLGELRERLLFSEALDTARCLESGLLRSTAT
ncbi:3-hydroxyacyl-CoA dehydrogenase/enoyl-CoA hydratase/3-hydroxybutyryl-CoA epimerase, partial [Arthrobacter sp. SLBN-100]|uniref:3-hydroxyacyl-CoA dehydrogenase NAD-binding domain-containing protein n=1 Tax=Arthrobacter sp. SLBN-100 TaxID=2768450 RepID=UPI00114F0845